jgi:hypothetical protein
MVVVSGLRQLTARAREKRDLSIVNLGSSGLDLGESVGLGGRWGDAGSWEGCVGVQGLEEIGNFLEEVGSFLAWSVIRVAAGVDGVVTCSVGGPFVLPEGLRTLVVALHVGIQVGNETALSIGVEDLGNVLVGARRVAVGWVGPVAVVGPFFGSVFSLRKFESIITGDRAYQRPWMVHESVGPVTGLVSQNWVWRMRPPGDSKQQEAFPEPQLMVELATQVGSEPATAPWKSDAAATAAKPMKEVGDMLVRMIKIDRKTW